MTLRRSAILPRLAFALTIAAPARAEAPTAGARASLPIGPTGLIVSVTPPDGWSPVADEDVPEVDVSAVPGAEVTLRKGWAKKIADARAPHEDRLVVVCAKAPADAYAPGIETLVFERMSGMVRTELGKQASVERLEAQPIETVGVRFEQRFSASGELGAELRGGKVRVGAEAPGAAKPVHVRAEGRHVVGFAGTPVVIAACSTVCVEADAPEGECAGALASLAFDGPFGPPPQPGLVSRVLVAAAMKPLAAGGVAFGALTTLVGLLLALRPKPRA